jgi:predicted transcriptional regulator
MHLIYLPTLYYSSVGRKEKKMMRMEMNNTRRRTKTTTTTTNTSERKNNRGKIQIMGDVLALGTSGIKKTHIMYKANLSYEQVHLYLGELIAKRLIAQDASCRSSEGIVYRTTEKGREFLQYYTRLTECLEEEEEGVVEGIEGQEQERKIGLSAPYIGRW